MREDGFKDILERPRWGCHTSDDVSSIINTWTASPTFVRLLSFTHLRIKKLAVMDIIRSKLAAIDAQ